MDDCMVENLGLLIPYYLFLLILLPVRAYEIKLLPPSYPPQWWPLSHTVKRIFSSSIVLTLLASLILSSIDSDIKPYLLVSLVFRAGAWMASCWILALEYKRYQPLTWVGLRGFWFLTGIESALRVAWSSNPSIAISVLTILTCLLELVLAIVAVWVPSDLNVNLLAHIQRLLLEHPSATEEELSFSNAVYTLHEDDGTNSRSKEGFQSKRGDTPGWIYSVEEELPFRPKIDVLDVQVVAINKDRSIKTVYRIQTRVSTDSDPPMVVEFNAKRRYKELRWLDDRLRACFDHSAFPEQRASMGSFPPREITQADPFARQVAFREYLRRLSQSPFFYCHEFLDMVGVDPRLDSGRLFESCLSLQTSEQSKVPNRQRKPPTPIGKQVNDVMPWRPPLLLSSSGTGSPLVSIAATPPLESASPASFTVSIPDFFTAKRVVYYRIVLITPAGVFESKHRFSDFQRLSVHLRDFLDIRPSVALPRIVRLPGMFGSPEEFLEDRRTSLEQYLQCIVGDFAAIVCSSRLVRTFFKLPTDSAIMPGVHAFAGFHDSPGSTEEERITPTSAGKMQFLDDLVPPSPSDHESSLPGQTLSASIPFFHYETSAEESPVVKFCCRFRASDGNEWTKFHLFEEFQKLRTDLNVSHAYLIDAIPDFPSVHGLWSARETKLEVEGRRRVLSKWLAHIVAEVLRQGQKIEDIEPLKKFVTENRDLL